MAKSLFLYGGMVCDGSGADPRPAEVLIEGERIADVAEPGTCRAENAEAVDCSGKVIAPGFIDAHSHGDARKLRWPDNRTKLLQGVTTEVDGNCGLSASCLPGEAGGRRWHGLESYFTSLREDPVSTNTVALCGHNSIRRAVMGSRDARPSADELAAMRHLLEEALSAGAAGWSSGLTYFPGKFADTAELVALAETTKGSKKIYATHLRSEGDKLLEAVDEALEIARAGSGRLQLSHLKTIFPQNFHKLDALLEKVEKQRAEGFFLFADRYPYIYSSTHLGQTLPPPYNLDTGIAQKLRVSTAFQEEIAEALKRSPRDLPTTIIPRLGRDIAELAAAEGTTAERVCMRLLMENPETIAAFRCMSEENMQRILAKPWVCAGSDGLSMQLDDPGDIGHPRAAGSFPRFFRIVSAGLGIGEAVRKMTSLPAAIFRIPERGLVRRGYFADLAVFDPAALDSRADFRGNNAAPSGIDRVLVAGKTAWCAAAPEKIGRFGRPIPID